MRIQFDPRQEYQLDAIRSVTDLFAGQPPAEGASEFLLEARAGLEISELGFANALSLNWETVGENLKEIQERNKLGAFARIDQVSKFTVEMETGTGKTYVYLRTIFELNRLYGWSKFVIVVPSVAIREGVLSSISLLKEHFRELYGAVPFDHWVYDSAQASRLRSFATSNTIQILILNIQAFDKKDINVIHQDSDRMSGYAPIEFLRTARPILILDEPQKIGSAKAREALASLDPLFELRYSATHREIVNPVYRLDPVMAYEMGLVKRIEVSSVTETGDFNRPYICVKSIAAGSRPKVVIEIDVDEKGAQKRKSVSFAKADADLFQLSKGREQYRGWIVDGFDSEGGWVSFTNGHRLHVGEKTGADTDAVMRVQIRETIQRHLNRVRDMSALPAPERMKVLSLFFIDEVKNYAPADGKLRRWFEEEYEVAARDNPDLGLPNVADVHGGYFAEDREGPKDSRGDGSSESDRRAYELIMRKKEELLSLDVPLQFIFSHSALREGWDNPNVFQICTLRAVHSEVDRRQQIGRGLRLPVQADGTRCTDISRAILTVIANESFEKFAAGLQQEIEKEFGVQFGNRIGNARKKERVSLKKNWNADPEFMEMWERIKPRTRYNVSFSTDELIRKAAARLSESPAIRKPGIKLRRARISVAEGGVEGTMFSDLPTEADSGLYEVPDLLAYLQARTQLTRKSIAAILEQSGRLGDAALNPQQFLNQALDAIEGVLRQFLVDGIEYERYGDFEYEQRIFEDEEIEHFVDKLVKVDRSIVDQVFFQSERERKFALGLDALEDVKLFFKLPSRFKIETPLGTYNPDWAIVKGDARKLYLVRETKGSTDPDQRRNTENQKIDCGRRHFETLGVDFDDLKSVDELSV